MYMMLLQLLLLAAGFVLLIKGADFFVKGASAIAHKFGVPQIIIGLTIVAMGTSAPEAAVSISAALSGNADITIGNVVGSNIINILLILGITSVIAPLLMEKNTIRIDIPFTILVTAIVIPLGMTSYSINRPEGVLLLLLFVIYLLYLFTEAKLV
jgi:cation:H+ antiporter